MFIVFFAFLCQTKSKPTVGEKDQSIGRGAFCRLCLTNHSPVERNKQFLPPTPLPLPRSSNVARMPMNPNHTQKRSVYVDLVSYSRQTRTGEIHVVPC